MKASDKQELKHDAYADTVFSGVAWAKQHQAPLLIAAVAVVVVIVGVLLLLNTRRQSREYSLQLLSEAEKQTNKLMNLKPDAKPEEKAAAAKEALKQLDTISREYGDTDAGRRALLLAAQVSAEAGQSAQSATYYERALNAASGDEGLAALARRGLATTLEDTGKTREALKHYETLAAGTTAAVEQAHLAWDIGRCHETLNEKDLALESYRKAVEKSKGSKWAELAEFRIGAITNPPKPPAATTTTLPPAAPAAATPAPAAVTTTTAAPKAAAPVIAPPKPAAPTPTATILLNPPPPLVPPTTMARPKPASPATAPAAAPKPAPAPKVAPTTLPVPAKTDSQPKAGN